MSVPQATSTLAPLLVLAHDGDVLGARVASELARRCGAGNVRSVRAEELGTARWSHHVDRRGRTRTRIGLADGFVIDRCAAIFNRLTCPALPQFSAAAEADRSYAQMEVSALLLAWLSSVEAPVFGRPTALSLQGPAHAPAAWRWMAARAGLPLSRLVLTTDCRHVSDRSFRREPVSAELPWTPVWTGPARLADPPGTLPASILVVGECALPEANAAGFRVDDRAIANACLELARLAGSHLLRVWVVRDSDGAGARWRFLEVEARPADADPRGVACIADRLLSLGNEPEASRP